MMLEVRGLSKSFRGLRAVNNVSFNIASGEILALIGPNGAGKTTCFNLIAGAIQPDAGTITLANRQINGLRPDQICMAGIGRTFQLVKPFLNLSVEDNTIVGALSKSNDMKLARQHAHRILELLGLGRKRAALAHELTLPERKRLEVARALGTQPKLLLLDEVMAGLRPTETDQMVTIFRDLNQETGLTILLTEHVMRAVMALAKRIVVLHHGEFIAQGLPEDVVRDSAVLECYLGSQIE